MLVANSTMAKWRLESTAMIRPTRRRGLGMSNELEGFDGMLPSVAAAPTSGGEPLAEGRGVRQAGHKKNTASSGSAQAVFFISSTA